MPIEKLEIKTEYDYDRDKHVVDFQYVTVLNKINELISAFNTREQDRSEQMSRLVQRIVDLEMETRMHVETLDNYSDRFQKLETILNTPRFVPADAVTPETIQRWKKLLEENSKRSPLGEFFHELREAEAQPKDEELEIKGCPWCGIIPEVKHQIHCTDIGEIDFYHVICENVDCYMQPCTPDEFETKQEAVSAWNKRVC